VRKVFNVLSVIAFVLTIVGALNWLLIGIAGFNLVTWISFGMAWLETTLYILVGISGIYLLVWLITGNLHVSSDDYDGGATYKYKRSTSNN